MSNIIYKDEGYKIQGAIFEVYKEIGSGLSGMFGKRNVNTKNTFYLTAPFGVEL